MVENRENRKLDVNKLIIQYTNIESIQDPFSQKTGKIYKESPENCYHSST